MDPAISTIKQSTELQDISASNFAKVLQGRVAGVEIMQTSSKPGAEMQIRIRGTRSLTSNNDPLIVLDGMPFVGVISDINVNDIQSIDILKNASAAAIYGSRGANGVILVTTNRGQKGQKARVSYNGYFGLKDVFAKYDMMDGPEFAKMRKYADMPAYVNNSPDEFDDVNTDWQDLFYKTGMVQSHNVGVSGGGKHTAYNFGVGYYDDHGVVPLEKYNRISLHGSFDQEIGKFVCLGFTTNNSYSITEGLSTGGMFNVLQMSPLINPYNADGSWKRTVNMPLDRGVWTYTRDIVEANKDQMLRQTKGLGSYNTVYGEVKIPGIEGLKYRANLGLNFHKVNENSYTGEGINNFNPTNPSSASINKSRITNWVFENLLSYDRLFANKHRLNIVATYSIEKTKHNWSQGNARDVAPNFQWPNQAQFDDKITFRDDQDEHNDLTSYMGQAFYSYDNKYMVTAIVHSAGISFFDSKNKWKTFPAISAGWNIGNESFLDNQDFINQLKLRAGYGKTSNNSGYYLNQLFAPNLDWEYSTSWNYGLDFSLLNNHLSGAVEYYKTNTKNRLLPMPVPAVVGFTDNTGETQNKGFELSLNGVILDNVNGWTWDIGINLYSNRNQIVSLGAGIKSDIGNAWFVGSPINVIYAPKYIGLWQEGDQYMNILEPQGNVGMIKIEYTGDYNADGTPTRALEGTGADRQVIEVDPDFQGGFNTRLGYKNFDLNVIGDFKNGGILVSSLYAANGYLNSLTGRRGQMNVDYWTPENTDAKYPKPGDILSGDNPKYGNTLALFDASYLKVRTITVGYTFNQKAIKDAGIQNLRLYATVQNPFVLFSPYTRETSMDPETNSYGNENLATTNGFVNRRIPIIGTNTPSTRNYLIGLNVIF
ncbi:SusC/RagA family TonB-linked outer membrane protein [Bacteroidia bacterium]|nr:SusC/RagA family TonB-linked outer membrane protein [Bacteroidia bacterium]GHT27115.1 SusC/RagA family TonB-linked outer membrane protein [Bacteroidia bacterium]GHU82815.1 SusC/RagA family TonB-linked outer membrane protein [Bacteroidia bacterium]